MRLPRIVVNVQEDLLELIVKLVSYHIILLYIEFQLKLHLANVFRVP
jgi:hypothetical protein